MLAFLYCICPPRAYGFVKVSGFVQKENARNYTRRDGYGDDPALQLLTGVQLVQRIHCVKDPIIIVGFGMFFFRDYHAFDALVNLIR